MTNVGCPIEDCDSDHVPNMPLLRKVYEEIVHNPENWRQSNWVTATLTTEARVALIGARELPATVLEQQWHCGTAYCFAGHAAVMSGWQPLVEAYQYSGTVVAGEMATHADHDEKHYIEDVAQHELGLTDDEADNLFAAGNDIDDILMYCNEIAERAGETF